MSEGLKPCPFCGSSNIREGGEQCSTWRYIACNGCCVKTPGHFSLEAAIAAWNRRASGWVAVKDLLPDPGVPVLVRIAENFSRGAMIVTYRRPEKNRRWNAYHDKITHWMPLPAVPTDLERKV
jgi:Lar family restriction alleviation protein